jgi:surfeit locus 1 family protein
MLKRRQATGGGDKKWLIVFPGLCFALGTWQVYRMQWKRELVQVMDRRLADEPIPLTPDALK